jgi:hypothetical protein
MRTGPRNPPLATGCRATAGEDVGPPRTAHRSESSHKQRTPNHFLRPLPTQLHPPPPPPPPLLLRMHLQRGGRGPRRDSPSTLPSPDPATSAHTGAEECGTRTARSRSLSRPPPCARPAHGQEPLFAGAAPPWQKQKKLNFSVLVHIPNKRHCRAPCSE